MLLFRCLKCLNLFHRPTVEDEGHGQYVMEPSHYIEVPKSIAEGIIEC